jgi:septal ring factor EnvC (AmiA/AmiB activator)
MSRAVRACLWAAIAAALVLMYATGSGILRDRERLAEMTKSLQESRARWEDTAARKEELQEELKALTEELREAKLTLEESTTRAEELKQDIEELKNQAAGRE